MVACLPRRIGAMGGLLCLSPLVSLDLLGDLGVGGGALDHFEEIRGDCEGHIIVANFDRLVVERMPDHVDGFTTR